MVEMRFYCVCSVVWEMLHSCLDMDMDMDMAQMWKIGQRYGEVELN